MKITSVALPNELTDKVDAIARDSERSRSFVVRKLLERALIGEERLAALEEIAAQGLEEYAEKHARERAPNPGEIIAESSTDGHRRIEAMRKIAAGNRKVSK